MANQNERDAILNIQRYLRQLSYHEPIPAPALDGIWGPQTAAAVRAFQELEGLSVTGVVDAVTWEALYAAYLASTRKHSAPVPLAHFPRISEGYALREGDESFLVRFIQYAPGELETIYEGFDEVKETGVYDEATKKAVARFQEKHALPVTGEVDRDTWDALATTYNREFGGYQSQ
jgi:peptidoglycan hydrolase-like protein with peptidoglycan-binding domain